MKIVQLLDVAMPLTNEEHNFLENHTGKIRITGLTERDQLVVLG